jgi:hypothetical protein
MKTRKISIARTIIAISLTALLLTGCIAASSQERRLLWSGTSGPNEMAYDYASFTGTVDGKVRAEAGQTVVLAYAATVNEGTLAIRVETPSQATLWETTLNKSTDEQQVELALSEAGTHTVFVTGNQTGGDFALSWTVQ